MRDLILFYESKDVVAAYEKVEDRYLAHLEVKKWNKSIKYFVINLLMDFCENVHPTIYAAANDDKHKKFLESVAFLPTEDGLKTEDGIKQLYEWRIL